MGWASSYCYCGLGVCEKKEKKRKGGEGGRTPSKYIRWVQDLCYETASLEEGKGGERGRERREKKERELGTEVPKLDIAPLALLSSS